MKYKEDWEKLTSEMGYWVDMDRPYLTFDNKYIESVWWLLSEMHKKGILYKGFTVQPYSPKAGTGLSTHELNQPGCYRMVKDTSAVAMFKIINDEKSSFLFDNESSVSFLAWTTTPWTLPSNTALGVGKDITYVKVETFNMYTSQPIIIIMAKDLLHKYFEEGVLLSEYKDGDTKLPYNILQEFKGSKLQDINYTPLFSYARPKDGDAFRVIEADFVTTDDGTGIVHLAPSFGADDNIVAKKNGIGSLTLVDKQGRFTQEVDDLSGQYVKDEFYMKNEEKPKYSADVQIVIKLKEQNCLFKSEKYEHSYPHCWRTDKPILYYPMDSWFVRTTAYKDRMIELNKTINWKPASTGEGRFGHWLENLVDWNLSRSRFWGVPLPIWRTEDKKEEICISSISHLKEEIQKSIDSGFMQKNPLLKFIDGDFTDSNYNVFDLHRPYVDEIGLVSEKGMPMRRELDLIDVWFDSGSMPYAQLHYPFENKELFDHKFPADFIAEGVDQTRGWFFTLHAISTMLFDSVAYKNVISNGLVLDKEGNKMSKRLDNAVNPFEILDLYGSDACRWYMMSNAQPWDNLKFNQDGIEEVKRKFFGTLHNTYSFFVLYANIDNFDFKEDEIILKDRPEIDRWIISELNSLIQAVKISYDDYDPTKSARMIQSFVIDKLSNWYIRLSRRRFWKGEYLTDKIAAYQTLYECLEKIAIISSPIAPFYMDRMFNDLNRVTQRHEVTSVHFSRFPIPDTQKIDHDLESRINLSQTITRLVLSLRKRCKIRVRQPLNRIMIPVNTQQMKDKIILIKDILLSELNIKDIEFISSDDEVLMKRIVPNFKILGPKYGKDMKMISEKLNIMNIHQIKQFEDEGHYVISKDIVIDLSEVEISFSDIPGWQVLSQDGVTVALDVMISDKLRNEGLSRELVNRIQNLRKDKGLEVVDRIHLLVEKNDNIQMAIDDNFSYICDEVLASSLEVVDQIRTEKITVDLVENISVNLGFTKI